MNVSTHTAAQAGHYPDADGSVEDDIGIGEVLAVLRRRAGLIAAIVLPVMVATALILMWLTPRYSAELLIMIESAGDRRIVSLESVAAGLSGDEESVQSESFVLASPALARRVIDRLDLDQIAEFMPAESIDPATDMASVVDTFLSRLEIAPQENSRVIAVRFSAEDPQRAALIANSVGDEYLATRLETKFEATRRATAWLGQRIDELRVTVADKEAAVERARRDFGLLEGNGATLSSQELAELNTQMVMARSARAEAEVRLAQVQSQARRTGGLDTTTEVLQSPLIQSLRQQEAEVERRVAELSTELGDKHPRMIALRAEATDLQTRIQGEVNKIIAGLRNEVRVAQAREASLSGSLEELKGQVSLGNENEIELRALEREAEANRALLDTLLVRQKETMSQEDAEFQQPDATIFSRADVPVEPAYPRTGIVLGLVLIGSLLLSTLVVLILELLDRGFRSGEQFEAVTGIPSIGFVPLITKPEEFRTLPGYVAGRPQTALGESMRTLNWSLKLAFPDQPPSSVLVTSSVPGEGKTTVASCLATAESKAGQRVVLVDADIRRPGVQELTGVALEPGLTNVLAGEVTIDDALARSEWSGLSVLPAGSPSPHAPNLLGSQKMELLLRDLVKRFDLVVIDSPPMLAAADARILCRQADATVMVAHWGKTRRKTARLCVRQLQAAGARLAGGLLTMVDIKRNSQYGYGDSDAYAGDLSKYYAS